MIASASTTITIYRGESVDEWGDEIDTDTVVETGIPASIVEMNVDAEVLVSGMPRVIRKATCRVGSEVDVRTYDRIYDEQNNESYTILSLSRLQNPVCAMDTKLIVQRVD